MFNDEFAFDDEYTPNAEDALLDELEELDLDDIYDLMDRAELNYRATGETHSLLEVANLY